MNTSPKIPFQRAVMLCVNTIIGAGVFVNIGPMTTLGGPLSFLGYWAAFLIMLPSIVTLARFAQLRPVSGGIYRYPREFISPLAGFMSGWSYFLGKCATVALMTHALTTLFMAQGLLSSSISPLVYDTVLILAIGSLNIAGVSITGKIQWLFTVLKLIPFILAVAAGALFIQSNPSISLFTALPKFNNLMGLLPFSLFAFSGFEVICAIGNHLEEPEKNAQPIIMTASLIVLTLYTLIQGILSIITPAEQCAGCGSLIAAGTRVLGSPSTAAIFVQAAFLAVISSIFSNLANNSWNMHALAHDGFFPFKEKLIRTNKHTVPWMALLVKIAIVLTMLYCSQEQIPLQNIAVACISLAHALNLYASFKASYDKKLNQVAPWISLVGIIVMFCVTALCCYKVATEGSSLIFGIIFSLGIVIAVYQQGLNLAREA